MSKFQVASTIKKVSSMADGGWQLKVDTQELSAEQVAAVAGLKDKYGWFIFSENALTDKDIPEEAAPEFENEKSPSERLRAVMYIYWDTKTKKDKTFEEFRRDHMEKIIQFWKDKLD